MSSEEEEWERDAIDYSVVSESWTWRNCLPLGLRLADDDYNWSGSDINKVNGK